MRIFTKIVTLFCFTAIAGVPLLATGHYEIAETEGSSKVNPLDILGDSPIHIPDQNRANRVKKAFTKSVQKRPLRTKKITPGIIYLTFDDGPGKGTANVLHTLREEGVEGTMFFIGRNIGRHPSLYRQALAMPNLLIANHTYTHANGTYARFYSSTVTVINDVDRAQRIIGGAKYLRLAGRNVWRLPGIYRNDHALSTRRRAVESPAYTALSNRGYYIYGWDIEWHFDHTTGNASYGADHMADRIEALYRSRHLAKAGKIVLLAHDYMFRKESGVLKLRELIQILKAGGWRFETLANYGSSTPAVLVRRKNPLRKIPLRKKVIHIAMSKKDPVGEQIRKQKRLLQLLR